MVKSYVPDPITVVVVRDGLYCWVKSVSLSLDKRKRAPVFVCLFKMDILDAGDWK